jgi:hypothetical protein
MYGRFAQENDGSVALIFKFIVYEFPVLDRIYRIIRIIKSLVNPVNPV